KMGWRGTQPAVADRWFASSQIHHGCGCRLIAKHKLDKMLVCAVTGELVDRDRNAAQNLRDWPDHASCGSVGATAPFVPGPSSDGTGGGSDALGTWRADVRPLPRRCAFRGEARTEPGNGRGTPRKGATSSGLTRVHSVATERPGVSRRRRYRTRTSTATSRQQVSASKPQQPARLTVRAVRRPG
ncbi:MAG: zinc ribbon domain-containing protein, partial [Candidatus Dormibacteria bacterium]